MGALVGVAGGVPVGLALDSLRRKREEATAREGERARIEHVLRVVEKSLDDNVSGLREHQETLGGDHLVVDPGISTAVWDSLAPDVARGLTAEPELLAALWGFFEGLEGLMAMHQRRLETMIGPAAALSTSEVVAGAIRQNAILKAVELVGKAESLSKQLAERPAVSR